MLSVYSLPLGRVNRHGKRGSAVAASQFDFQVHRGHKYMGVDCVIELKGNIYVFS